MGLSTEINGQRRPVSWGAVRRNRWIILGCTIAVVAISLVLTQRSLPVYRGASTLRIEQKESNLPEAFRTPRSDSRLPTEMEELRSRTLAEDVVKELGLRLILVDPKVRRRSDLLREVRVSDSAVAAEYRLVRLREGGVALLDDSTGTRTRRVCKRTTGRIQRVQFPARSRRHWGTLPSVSELGSPPPSHSRWSMGSR